MHHYSDIERDFLLDTSSNSRDFWTDIDYLKTCDVEQQKEAKPLREKNNSGKNSGYKHIPHRDKPPQVVAKRNARERRRVQAVNNAFVKLRNVVPIQNARGKRISKVKTLLCAIDYIRALDNILQERESYTLSCEMMDYELPKNLDYDTAGGQYYSFDKDRYLSSSKYFK